MRKNGYKWSIPGHEEYGEPDEYVGDEVADPGFLRFHNDVVRMFRGLYLGMRNMESPMRMLETRLLILVSRAFTMML